MAKAKSDEGARLAKLAKLIDVQKDLVDKLTLITSEVDELLGGGAGVGAKMKELTVAFETAWAGRYGAERTYVWNGGKDFAAMKRLIRKVGVEDLERRIDTYMRSSEPHHVSARHSFPMFVGCVNSLIAAPLLDGDDVEVIGCKHSPPCATDAQHTKKKLAEARA